MNTTADRARREAMAAAIADGTQQINAAVVNELAHSLRGIVGSTLPSEDLAEEVGVEVAAALLAIAELAMPDSYFADDSRCRLARAVLVGSGHPAEEKYT